MWRPRHCRPAARPRRPHRRPNARSGVWPPRVHRAGLELPKLPRTAVWLPALAAPGGLASRQAPSMAAPSTTRTVAAALNFMLSPEMGLLLQPLLRRGLALVVARAVAGDLRAAAFFTGAASSFAAAASRLGAALLRAGAGA